MKAGHGRVFFTSDLEKVALASQKSQMSDYLARFRHSGSENYRYDFRPEKISRDEFPFLIWNKLMRKCLQEFTDENLYFGQPQGEPELRARLAKYLATYRGLLCSPEQVVLSSGTNHSLSILCLLIAGRVKNIAMEEPGYSGARTIFQSYGLRTIPIPLESDGINLGRLFRSRANAVYVTPSHQYPLGMATSVSKRTSLLDWATGKNGLIIEDDYSGHFRYDCRPIPSLQGMRNPDKVVYLGSFSKVLFPAACISYMVLPEPLLDKFKQLCQTFHSPVPFLYQKTLELFMEAGHLERHLRKSNLIHKNKHDLMLQALQQKLGENIEICHENQGVHIIIKVKTAFTEQELIAKALKASVKINPICQHWAQPRPDKEPLIALGFSGIAADEIKAGIGQIAKAWFE